ncbi:hypothetical protein NCS57_00196900 [Fusarium keratoplasticum]|uniref:Uncharacterized protein n=1 Tax=Fusarium keratoplasticum TaxID=1328300 RepID=A0ACC0RA66_9HYPO|nr:hypothetical protein NCS57_00196900 [Fusarium keratoplasticum]KAI8679197.1 hypothetical protein NCS57_00196900 [Fusarium keratoplasticum]
MCPGLVYKKVSFSRWVIRSFRTEHKFASSSRYLPLHTSMGFTSKWLLGVAYTGAYLTLFVVAMQQHVIMAMTPYITSGFSSHSLIPVISQMAFIILGIVSLAVSRLVDLWGLAQGFGLMVLATILGLLLMMFCRNIEMYTAAVVIHEIGYGGILYTLLVFVTQNAKFKYRPLAIAFTKVPYIATTFAGPRAAEAFYNRGLTKWAFGSFVIILPSIAGPLFCILLYSQCKMSATSSFLESHNQQVKSGFFGTLLRYLKDFDVVGISLACWFSYFTSHLQVVHNMGIGEAGYLANTNYVGTGVAAVVAGICMRYLGRARTTTLAALSIYTLGTGMMIQFTSSGSSSALGGVIASQVLISLSAGIHAVGANIGALDGASQSTLSMRLALVYLSSMIGSSIALAISGAIWTNTLPARLASNLAGLGLTSQEETSIYGSLIVQLSYDLGTPVRDAIIRSYRGVFRILMIVATATSVVSWVGALMMRDITAGDRDAKEEESELEQSHHTRGDTVAISEK